MKKSTLIASAAIMTGAIALAACGDDDPSTPSTPSAPVVPPQETTGTPARPHVRIRDISSNGRSIMSFTYDRDGMPAVITDAQEHVTYTVTPGRYMTLTVDDGDYDDYKTYQNLSFNTDGYLTSATIVEGHGYKARITGRLSASYDAAGHLAELTVNETDGSYETASFTWTEGNLTAVVITEADNRERETDTITYTYGSDANATGQYVYDADALPQAGITGWFGKPSAMLPQTRTVSEHDKAPQQASYTYTLNADGTIDTQKVSYNNGIRTRTYVYAY